MGNVESDPSKEDSSKTVQTVYPGFKQQESCEWIIEREEFLAKFDPRLQTLAQSLWKHSSQSSGMPLSVYGNLITKLDDRSDKMHFFLTLAAETNGIQSKATFTLLFSWLMFGQAFSESFQQACVESLLTLSESVDILSNRLSSFYADAADDLSRLVAYILKSDKLVSIGLVPMFEFSPLLTEDILWLLSMFLTYSFKRPIQTCLVDAAPLEIEQLGHLKKLYDSASDGFSITRIKELTFEYAGPLILFLKAGEYLLCLASDQGLKDSLRCYGTENSKLLQIYPKLATLVSGRSSRLAGPTVETGIIYSNFSAKTAKRGLMVGHQPLAAPAIEINEGFTELKYTAGPPIKLDAVEIWVAGSEDQLSKLQSQKVWDLKQVNKEKNRKVKLDEDWRQSTDRQLLSMAGINVNHSALIEQHEAEVSSGLHNMTKHPGS